MRELLFLCHRLPYPPDKGDKIRAFHIIEHLRQSYRIHLGCLADDRADLAHLPALRERTASLACFPLHRRRARLLSLAALPRQQPMSAAYFRNPGLVHWVRATLTERPITQLFVFSSSMAPYVMAVPNLPCILDMVDVDSEKFRAYAAEARGPMRLLWEREASTLLRLERAAAQHFDRTLFVSAAEEETFLERAPECIGRTGWVKNGVDTEYFSPEHRFPSPWTTASPAIVFTGTMDYKPNVSAVTWFADAVLPLLAERTPPLLFVIVGTHPTRAVQKLASRGHILVTGHVSDTRPFLAHASVVVAPLRIGRGIQNKVLEAMAMARPVVASPAALEGIGAVPGRDVLVGERPAEVARLVGEVLDGRHAGLGPAARQTVVRAHDWDAALARLDPLLSQSPSPRVGTVGASA